MLALDASCVQNTIVEAIRKPPKDPLQVLPTVWEVIPYNFTIPKPEYKFLCACGSVGYAWHPRDSKCVVCRFFDEGPYS